jgi:primosomal protein N' (replication factor Y)
MTYHRANGKLMCHYCGHMQPMTVRCPDCGSEHIRYSGVGTQRVEEELKQLFPDISVLRMDTDTTMSRFAYEERFKEFAEGKYTVMIGTQMVAKGLDFPNVTLVGVLSADQSLYAGDYRAYENTFSLLTQVIGRAGRRETAGKAIIQTTVPDHYVIGQASVQDFNAFFDVEIAMRKQMKYPPFTELCVFALSGVREAAVKEAAGRLLLLLQQTVTKPAYQGLPMIVLDPTPAAVSRVSGKYRYKLLVKLGGTALSRQLVGEVLAAFAADNENREVSVYADRNPATIL